MPKLLMDSAFALSDVVCAEFKVECESKKLSAGRLELWADTVVSPLRRHIRLTVLRNPPFTNLFADHNEALDLFAHNRIYTGLLKALASCYGLYVMEHSVATFVGRGDAEWHENAREEFLDNLSGTFDVTQSKTTGNNMWTKRLLNAVSIDAFWEEVNGAIQRYFEFAIDNRDALEGDGL